MFVIYYESNSIFLLFPVGDICEQRNIKSTTTKKDKIKNNFKALRIGGNELVSHPPIIYVKQQNVPSSNIMTITSNGTLIFNITKLKQGGGDLNNRAIFHDHEMGVYLYMLSR